VGIITFFIKHFKKTLSNEWGCFWGGGGGGETQEQQQAAVTPAQQPAAAPNPQPQPVPTETAPMETADRKRKKIEALKYGMLSTMKTGGTGITGAGPELNTPEATAGIGGKKTLGA